MNYDELLCLPCGFLHILYISSYGMEPEVTGCDFYLSHNKKQMFISLAASL